jgi:hypothetical protein
MSTLPGLLPREVSALVHHIELNRAGWWDKTLNRLVLAAVWLSKSTSEVVSIDDTLRTTFHLSIGHDKLISILSALEAENSLIQISPGVYRVPDKARTALDQDIAAAENVEKRAREFFLSLAENVCPDLDGLAVWDAFERHVLVPLVRDVGANTCRLLIAEDRIVADAFHADSFIAHASARSIERPKDSGYLFP